MKTKKQQKNNQQPLKRKWTAPVDKIGTFPSA